ncbi:hypothetical protein PZN02_006085 (plasmid) [Sinorhizobium garamanticum]|uniref:Uncharacterized protein n=1 Tax=Sinorhizobium garamanticum TaxID=680247 RepID=A0ABY8DSB3_9HYPH|nr:hypothetical protein [Sinorhizobium garamanticum]WEX91768.1 hypothetical protein PZN02_006085 [Sinorhizobium garamanticum]
MYFGLTYSKKTAVRIVEHRPDGRMHSSTYAAMENGGFAPPPGRATAPSCAHLGNVERFSQMLNEPSFKGCVSFEDAPGKTLGSRELESKQRCSEAPTRQNMLHFLGATWLGVTVLKTDTDIRDTAEPGARPRSAIVAELAETICILVGRGNDDSTVQIIVLQEKLLGDAKVTISYRHDTLRVLIEPERLRAFLQRQGYAFARDLSDRLGVRILVAAVTHSSSPEEQDNTPRSRGFEAVLHYVAERRT